ncbi:MAG: hypothetical protein F6K11_21350, partial [Leptolyngbya sp. SIO3F4]|nr:hypothetical protein [Leptolyngbya sp. SIO3F4]
MRRFVGLLTASVLATCLIGFTGISQAQSLQTAQTVTQSPALEIQATKVDYLAELDLLVFEQQLNGDAGSTLPQAAGQLDGAP